MNGPNTPIEDEETASPARRSFLKSGLYATGAFLLSGLGLYKYFRAAPAKEYAGSIVGASSNVGHLLRESNFTAATEVRKTGTIIVGGGIAGLSAAWWLKKHGYQDFVLLELESKVGGNAASGKNAISAYPWGAHYLPLPGPEAQYVRALLEELGTIHGYDAQGLPIYDEYQLCADPHERLFVHGRWQEGTVPQIGLNEDERRQYDEFFALIAHYKIAKGNDGKPAFAIPLDLSSRDPQLLALDRISMAEFMQQKGWDSKYLLWYVNYCCRDDYGTLPEQVSAWAGLHYFASRNGVAANADAQTVLTWPQGNGWLVERLREKSAQQIQENALAFSLENRDGGVCVDYFDTATQKTVRIEAKNAICATPRFVAARIVRDLAQTRPAYLDDLRYSPWMVANVSVRSVPSGKGAPLSWDNISYYSPSLGYVVATHQNLSLFPRKTVLTYYLPLSHADPVSARKAALQKTHQDWAKEIVADLENMHPGIQNEIEQIDVWLWGHGMIIPHVGFISGRSRQAMQEPLGNIRFAHSDMSGISIFEEAQYRGVQAAQSVLSKSGRSGENA